MKHLPVLLLTCILGFFACKKPEPAEELCTPSFSYYTLYYRPLDSAHVGFVWRDSIHLYYAYDTTKLYKVLHHYLTPYEMPVDTPFYAKIKATVYFDNEINDSIFPDTAIYTNKGDEFMPAFTYNERRRTGYELTRIK